MRFFRGITLASLFWARFALADSLATPGLLGTPPSTPACLVVNVLSAPIDVTIELRGDDNASFKSTACPGLPGGHTCTVTAPMHSGSIYCRATTPELSAICMTMMMVAENGEVTSAVVSRRED